MIAILIFTVGLIGSIYQANCYRKYLRFVNNENDDDKDIFSVTGKLTDDNSISGGAIVHKVILYEANKQTTTQFIPIGKMLIPMTRTDMHYNVVANTLNKIIDYKTGKIYMPMKNMNRSSFRIDKNPVSFSDNPFIGANKFVEEIESSDIGPYLDKYKIDYQLPSHSVERYKLKHYQLYHHQHVMAVFGSNLNITMIGCPQLVKTHLRRVYNVRPWAIIGSIGLMGTGYYLYEKKNKID